ncbi:MAG: hypothetical protein WCD77_19910 [Acidobacteriaceae bacterium]|jgi:ABC-type lipoprotein release transport system permease subunit
MQDGPTVASIDPATFLAVAALPLLTALAACLMPTRRAAFLDAMVALRHE